MTFFSRRFLLALLSSVLLAACATTGNNDASVLARLCGSKDLTSINQRELLAGGFYAIQSKDLVCAERLTEQARKVDPKDAYAALNLGAIYQRTGRVEQAEKEYKDAIALDGGEVQSADSVAVLATAAQAKNQRPSEIAKRNLALLRK